MTRLEQIADDAMQQMHQPTGFRLTRIGELEPRPIDWLVSDLFEVGSMVVPFGPPGSAKSFLMLAISACIAAGKDYHGRPVKQGPAIYLCGEGYNGIVRRIEAWCIVNGIQRADLPLYVSNMPASMTDTENLATVMRQIDQIGQPAIITLDTVARNFGPGDENSTRDMSDFVTACDQLRHAYGSTVALVHHTGHGDQARARGSSVLNAAVDTAIRVNKDEAGIITVECTKQKDAVQFDPFAFKFRTVELGYQNDDGTDAVSAVLHPCDMPAKASSKPKGQKTALGLHLLRQRMQLQRERLEIAGHDPDTARVLLKDWREDCDQAGIAKSSFHYIKDALISANEITEEPGGFVKVVGHDL